MLVVDTGPLVAAATEDDRRHERSAELLERAAGPLVVPMLVITEVAYFLGLRHGQAAEETFAASFESGELLAEPVERADWTRIRELIEQYSDLGLGIVDASVISTCERLGQTKLATLDRRHFSVVRPRNCAAFELLPA